MFGNPEDFFHLIANKSQLQEGAEGVLRIIRLLYRFQDLKITNKEFSRHARIPNPVISAVRGELIKAGFLKTKNLLTSNALNWIEESLMMRFKSSFFNNFNPTSVLLSEEYLSYFESVKESLEDRPSPEYKYDQSRSTFNTVCKRALIMLRNGDVEGKRVVLLGDDDGLSVALAHLNCAKEIFVLDIDSRVLTFINSFAERKNCEQVLHTCLWDIRTAFPSEWLNQFNVFEMDPPYTVPGFKLFVDRALSLVNPDQGFRGYISFGNKSPFEKWACQEHLNSSGLVITEYIPNFNQYIGATILGNSSNLYVVESVPQKVVRTKTIDQKQAIYTFNEVKIKDFPTIGYQIIAEFYGVKNKFLTNADYLKEVVSTGLKESQLHIEEFFLKEYSPYGLSLIFILVESHCHIHTWPEHDYLSMDLFVCEQEEKAESFFRYLQRIIQPLDYHKFQFYRGQPPLTPSNKVNKND
jgi:S-adenosylmethionine decarboxylase proenzyme